MPDFANPNVDIQSVEAEITGATRAAEGRAAEAAPAPEDMARLIRETVARDAWRAARLTVD